MIKDNRTKHSTIHFGIIIAFLTIFISCSSTGKKRVPHNTHQMPDLPSYSSAVKSLGAELALALEGFDTKDASEKTYYIYNTDILKSSENALTRKFIQDLKSDMVNRGITIVENEIATWGRSTGGESGVECKEILEAIASDYMIKCNLSNCLENSSCIEAKAEVIQKNKNSVLASKKAIFKTSPAIADLFNRKIVLSKRLGSKEVPYSSLQDASHALTGILQCKLSNMLKADDALSIVIGKTENTPQYISDSIYAAAGKNGFAVNVNGKWLTVVLQTQDNFEKTFYAKLKQRQKLSTSGLVLWVDSQIINSNNILDRKSVV